MRAKITFLLLTLFTLAISCAKEDEENCVERHPAYVTAVNAPESGTVNQPLNLTIDFAVSNGCGTFDKFIETDSGNTRMVEILAAYQTCGVCSLDAPTRTVEYIFTPSSAGEYIFKFKSGPEEYITVDVTIQ